jgi:hypothetical protein
MLMSVGKNSSSNLAALENVQKYRKITFMFRDRLRKYDQKVRKDEKLCSREICTWESIKKYERVRDSLSKCEKHVKACEKISGK